MIESDIYGCYEAIRKGSHSFYAASKLLPKPVRDPAVVLYAFCRVADDTVDPIEVLFKTSAPST